jgi:type IV pilus assembly protein PilV
MLNYKNQKGMGLLEILVALLLLAIGVLGYVALQYRAIEATSEATYRAQGINIARDLAERIRVNRYKTEISTTENQKISQKNCSTSNCTSTELADFDVSQVAKNADALGMTINMMTCKGNNNGRNCIYVAWADTSATDGDGVTDCTNGTSYNTASTCLIMEVY